MSDDTTTHDDEPQTSGIKALREKAEQDARELAAARRELALVKAGVDVESPLGKMFAKAYDGDLDPEVIRAEWSGLAPAPAAPEEPPPSDEGRIRDGFARDGRTPVAEDLTENGPDRAIKAGRTILEQGGNPELAREAYVANMVDAAVRDLPGARHDRQKWLESFGR